MLKLISHSIINLLDIRIIFKLIIFLILIKFTPHNFKTLTNKFS
jgi:hypothetical protein